MNQYIIMNDLSRELWDEVITQLHNGFCFCTSNASRPSTWDAPLPPYPRRRCKYNMLGVVERPYPHRPDWRGEAVFYPDPGRALVRNLCSVRLVNRLFAELATKWLYSHGWFTFGLVGLKRRLAMNPSLMTRSSRDVDLSSDLEMSLAHRLMTWVHGVELGMLPDFTGLRLDFRVREVDLDEYEDAGYAADEEPFYRQSGARIETRGYKTDVSKGAQKVASMFDSPIVDGELRNPPALPSVQALEIRLDKEEFYWRPELAQFIYTCLPGVTDLVLDCYPETAIELLLMLPTWSSSLRRLVLSCGDHWSSDATGHMPEGIDVIRRLPSLCDLSVRNFSYFYLKLAPQNHGLTRLHLSNTTVPVLLLEETLVRGPSTAVVPSEHRVGGDNGRKGDSPLTSLVLDCVTLVWSEVDGQYISKTWAEIFYNIRVSCPNIRELEVSCFQYHKEEYRSWEDSWEEVHQADVFYLQGLLDTIRATPGGEARAQVFELDGQSIRML
ncbi:hypothetical protein VTJ49DRAFT_3225 [Mycothermus thermophilus]|uniref:F-box domain-containing protein n=1 Tax=Humicola insolens TaxID=85995 RepID=A0ABR3V815_HUMIN